jgi:hypothetical protein
MATKIVRTIHINRQSGWITPAFTCMDYINNTLPTLLWQTPVLSPTYHVYDDLSLDGVSVIIEFYVSNNNRIQEAQTVVDVLMEYLGFDDVS